MSPEKPGPSVNTTEVVKILEVARIVKSSESESREWRSNKSGPEGSLE